MSYNIKKNPFKHHILYYYYLTYNEILSGNYEKVLDVGCGEGNFISKLKGHTPKLYGFDVDRYKIQKAKQRWKFVKFSHRGVSEPLPYSSNFFDVVCLLHVLEHVDSEKRILQEVYRVLKPNGIVIIASPHRGIFTWADTANLRYHHPFLHRVLGHIYFGRQSYREKFILQKDNQMFGDSTISRGEHTHYTEVEIRKLLKNKFEIQKFDKFSLFLPFLYTLYNIWEFLFKKDNFLIKQLIWIDHHIKAGNLSYNLFIVAKKCTKE